MCYLQHIDGLLWNSKCLADIAHIVGMNGTGYTRAGWRCRRSQQIILAGEIVGLDFVKVVQDPRGGNHDLVRRGFASRTRSSVLGLDMVEAVSTATLLRVGARDICCCVCA